MLLRKFLSAVVIIPLGIFLIIFAVANRHLVTVSFDPFNSATPTVAVTLPLFVVIIAVAMLGVLAGGMATWFRQGRWRRAARQSETEASRMRTQLADLRTHAGREQRYPALSQGGIYGSAGRDKQGATL